MTNRLYLGWAVLLTATAFAAEAPAERVQISKDQLVSALERFHLPVQKPQVQLLSEVTAKTPGASVQVVGVERWNDREALARFRCTRTGDCPPFYVAVRWPSAADRDMALAGLQTSRPSMKKEKKEILVRAGQKATLIVTNNKFRANTPVLCLENGAQGQKIRVATTDRKQITQAEVVDSGVLRGSF